jgi:hypothetical protein
MSARIKAIISASFAHGKQDIVLNDSQGGLLDEIRAVEV